MTITKKVGLIAALSSAMFFNTGCTPQEEAFAAGTATGVVVGSMMSYDYPYYYDRPYYYYGGIYYYGGRYYNGYYYYRGRKLYGGHYYYNGYRYHQRKRYRAVNGEYGYYRTQRDYERRHRR